jgi:4-hydroxy-tetrahydrodipicolinate synthase
MSTHLAHGLWVILATPFDDTGALDQTSLARQVRFARDAGADGLVALGVFGEAAHLSLAEQRAVAETVAGAAEGTPLVLGVAGRSSAVCVEQGLNALAGASAGGADPGSTGLMVQVSTPAPASVVRHLTAVHEATGAGIVLQDYPAVSGVKVGSAQILEVVAGCGFVTAVKAESPPTPVAIGELTAGTDVPVFGGLGGVGLVDELTMGAAGAMTGFSAPEGLRATIDAHRSGGFAAARDAWAPWLPLANFEAQLGIALAVRKMLLHRRGVLDHPTVRPPAPSLPDLLVPLLELQLAAAPLPVAGTSATGPTERTGAS